MIETNLIFIIYLSLIIAFHTMSVLQSQVDVYVLAIFITAIIGYVFLISYGSQGVQHLAVLAGLGAGTLALVGTFMKSTGVFSVGLATIVLGTGALFLLLAYRGNRNITDLIQRVERDGAVVLDD